jgi:hypothetical protein
MGKYFGVVYRPLEAEKIRTVFPGTPVWPEDGLWVKKTGL